jgi:hypothetical protein
MMQRAKECEIQYCLSHPYDWVSDLREGGGNDILYTASMLYRQSRARSSHGTLSLQHIRHKARYQRDYPVCMWPKPTLYLFATPVLQRVQQCRRETPPRFVVLKGKTEPKLCSSWKSSRQTFTKVAKTRRRKYQNDTQHRMIH